MRWFSLFLVFLLAGPGFCREHQGRVGEQSFVVEAPDSWELRNNADAGMGLHLRKGEAAFVVRIGEAKQALKGALTFVRYAVVIRLGGEILSDQGVTIDGIRGQRLIYTGISSQGEPRHFFRVILIEKDLEVVLHAVAPAEAFPALENELRAMVKSFRRLSSEPPEPPVVVPSTEDEEPTQAPEL